MVNNRRRQRRSTGRRRPRATRRGRSTRSALSQRVANVRNSTTYRSRSSGFGNIALTCLRRFASYPARPKDPSGKNPSWWLDTVAWFGSIVLDLLAFAFLTPHQHGAAIVYTGGFRTIDFAASDLLVTSPLCQTSQSTQLVTLPYRQARIDYVKVSLFPSADLGKRGGFYAAAMVSIDISSLNRIRRDADAIVKTFDNVSRMPGSIVRPTTSPITVSWSPTIMEIGSQWLDLNVDTMNNLNDNKVCTLIIAFSDMAMDDASKDPELELSPQHALIEMNTEARIHLRQPGPTTLSQKVASTKPQVHVQCHGSVESYDLDTTDKDENGTFIPFEHLGSVLRQLRNEHADVSSVSSPAEMI